MCLKGTNLFVLGIMLTGAGNGFWKVRICSFLGLVMTRGRGLVWEVRTCSFLGMVLTGGRGGGLEGTRVSAPSVGRLGRGG